MKNAQGDGRSQNRKVVIHFGRTWEESDRHSGEGSLHLRTLADSRQDAHGHGHGHGHAQVPITGPGRVGLSKLERSDLRRSVYSSAFLHSTRIYGRNEMHDDLATLSILVLRERRV